ncbi:tetratricopeptide repeat protein [Oceanobacillus sp. CAU 1775]
METKNIILFPKWQKTLEVESVRAIKDRSFEEGLAKLNMLLDHQVENHDIYTGKLICLMELERYEEAQDLCETLISVKDVHYDEYIHIYLTILFQTNQYGMLMDIVESELENGNIRDNLVAQFRQLYEMSEKMRLDVETDRSNIYLDALYDAVNQENHIEQWRLINKISKLKLPPSEKVVSLLSNEYVHPLNKSAIFLWLKEKGVTKPVDIHKFGVHIKMIPKQTPDIKDNLFANAVYQTIEQLEHKNPTLYKLVEKLFEKYLYVLYPISPPIEDAELVAESLIIIGEEYLNLKEIESANENDEYAHYIQEIKTSEILYTTIINE